MKNLLINFDLNNYKKAINDIIKNHYDYLFGLMILILPFSSAIPNLLLGLLMIFFLLQTKQVDFKSIKKLHFLLLFVLLLYLIIKSIVLNTFELDYKTYSRFLFILILPFLFLKIYSHKLIKQSFVLSVLLIILKSIYNILNYYLIYKYIPLSNGLEVNQILIIERPYLGFMVAITIIFLFEEILVSRKKIGLIILLNFILLFVFFIAARNSLLTIGILFFIYLVFYLDLKKSKKIAFLILSLILFSVLFSLNKNLKDRLYYEGNLKEIIKKNSALEPRYVIWPCVINIASENNFNLLFGLESESKIIDKLSNCYSNSIIENNAKKEWFQKTKYNTHNQFLGIFLLGGLFGLSILVLFFIVSYLSVKNNFISLAVLIAFTFFLLFENVLYRQLGCYLLGILIPISLMAEKKQNKKI